MGMSLLVSFLFLLGTGEVSAIQHQLNEIHIGLLQKFDPIRYLNDREIDQPISTAEDFWPHIYALTSSHEFMMALSCLKEYSSYSKVNNENRFQILFAAFWIGIQDENLNGEREGNSPFPILEAREGLAVYMNKPSRFALFECLGLIPSSNQELTEELSMIAGCSKVIHDVSEKAKKPKTTQKLKKKSSGKSSLKATLNPFSSSNLMYSKLLAYFHRGQTIIELFLDNKILPEEISSIYQTSTFGNQKSSENSGGGSSIWDDLSVGILLLQGPCKDFETALFAGLFEARWAYISCKYLVDTIQVLELQESPEFSEFTLSFAPIDLYSYVMPSINAGDSIEYETKLTKTWLENTAIQNPVVFKPMLTEQSPSKQTIFKNSAGGESGRNLKLEEEKSRHTLRWLRTVCGLALADDAKYNDGIVGEMDKGSVKMTSFGTALELMARNLARGSKTTESKNESEELIWARWQVKAACPHALSHLIGGYKYRNLHEKENVWFVPPLAKHALKLGTSNTCARNEATKARSLIGSQTIVSSRQLLEEDNESSFMENIEQRTQDSVLSEGSDNDRVKETTSNARDDVNGGGDLDEGWQIWVNQGEEESSLHVDALNSHHVTTLLYGNPIEYVIFPSTDMLKLGFNPWQGGLLKRKSYPRPRSALTTQKRSKDKDIKKSSVKKGYTFQKDETKEFAYSIARDIFSLPFKNLEKSNTTQEKGSKSTRSEDAARRFYGTNPWRSTIYPGDTLLIPGGCPHAYRSRPTISTTSTSSTASTAPSKPFSVVIARNFVDSGNALQALSASYLAAAHPFFPYQRRSRHFLRMGNASYEGDDSVSVSVDPASHTNRQGSGVDHRTQSPKSTIPFAKQSPSNSDASDYEASVILEQLPARLKNKPNVPKGSDTSGVLTRFDVSELNLTTMMDDENNQLALDEQAVCRDLKDKPGHGSTTLGSPLLKDNDEIQGGEHSHFKFQEWQNIFSFDQYPSLKQDHSSMLIKQQLVSDSKKIEKIAERMGASFAKTSTSSSSSLSDEDWIRDKPFAPNGGTFFLSATSEPRFTIERIVQRIFLQHTHNLKLQGSLQGGAEWWIFIDQSSRAASTSGSSNSREGGLYIHYDKDTWMSLNQKGSKFPYRSTVTYLEDGSSASITSKDSTHTRNKTRNKPTSKKKRIKNMSNKDSSKQAIVTKGAPIVVFDHQEENPTFSAGRKSAWISWPYIGKHIAFSGDLLHAVPPSLRWPLENKHLIEDTHNETNIQEEQEQSSDKTKQSRLNNLDGKEEVMIRISLAVNVWLGHIPVNVPAFPSTQVHKLSDFKEFSPNLCAHTSEVSQKDWISFYNRTFVKTEDLVKTKSDPHSEEKTAVGEEDACLNIQIGSPSKMSENNNRHDGGPRGIILHVPKHQLFESKVNKQLAPKAAILSTFSFVHT